MSPACLALLAAALLAAATARAQAADDLQIGDPIDAVELGGEAAHKQTVDGMIRDLTPEIESGRLSAAALERALAVRCWAYYERDELDRALADCNRVLTGNPDHGSALVLRGSAKTKRGQYAAAIADFDRAIDRGDLDSEERAGAYLRRGVVRQAIGDGARAAADVSQAIALNPKLKETHREISEAMLGRGKSRDAVGALDAMLGLDPGSAAAFVDRGLGRLARGQLDSAIADFDKALEMDAYSAAAYRGRGEARLYKGFHDGALADYDRAMQLDAHLAPTLKGRAIVEFNLGRFEDAAQDLASAVKADAKNAYAILWLFLSRQRSAASTIEENRRQLAEQMRAVALGEWPAPVLRFYAGQRSQAEMFAAAARGTNAETSARKCEAEFFAGQFALAADERDSATALLQLAATDCPPATAAAVTAKAELARSTN